MDFGSIADKVVTSTITWIVTGGFGPVVLAAIPSVRKWLAAHPSITGLIAGGFAGMIVSLALWTLLPPQAEMLPDWNYKDEGCTEDPTGATVCVATCKVGWVVLSGECEIEGDGKGGTGFIQNIGVRKDGAWYCTWQPIKGSSAKPPYTKARAWCVKKARNAT